MRSSPRPRIRNQIFAPRFQRLFLCLFFCLPHLFPLEGISSLQRTNSLHSDPSPSRDVLLPACSIPIYFPRPHRDLSWPTSLIILKCRFAFRSENAFENTILG